MIGVWQFTIMVIYFKVKVLLVLCLKNLTLAQKATLDRLLFHYHLLVSPWDHTICANHVSVFCRLRRGQSQLRRHPSQERLIDAWSLMMLRLKRHQRHRRVTIKRSLMAAAIIPCLITVTTIPSLMRSRVKGSQDLGAIAVLWSLAMIIGIERRNLCPLPSEDPSALLCCGDEIDSFVFIW